MTPTRRPGIPAPVLAWAVIAAIAWVVAALAAIALYPRPADAGAVRYVPIGGTIRAGAHGLVVERNRTHAPRGLARPRCAGADLRIDLRPRSRVAGWATVSVDGSLLDRGISAGLRSVQGGRILVAFRDAAGPVTCAEAFADPAANLWLSVTQVVR